jgi:hypothetical protein
MKPANRSAWLADFWRAFLLLPACLSACLHPAIVRNKDYPQSGWLRVNMGNIYLEQKKYPTAIKMYRMALDQIAATAKEVGGDRGKGEVEVAGVDERGMEPNWRPGYTALSE